MNSIKIIESLKSKFNYFFSKDNIKNHIILFTVVTILFTISIVLAYTLGYQTEHNKIYEPGFYVLFLGIFYILYLIKLFVSNKKSSSDLMIIIYLFFILWDVVYKVGLIKNDLLVPSPEGLFDVFKTDSKYLMENVFDSLKLLFWGFLLAIILGTVLGLIVGWFQRSREVLIPISNAITLIPPILITAWLIMWFPFNIAAIAIIFLSVFWPLFQTTIHRVSEIDRKIIEAARVMGVSNIGMIFKVVLPYSLPGIISGISKSLRGAFMCLVAAEMIGINGGIGFYTETYKAYADYRRVLAGIVSIGFITSIMDLVIKKIEQGLIKWKV